MEARLIIALDEDSKISKTLLTMDLKMLDEYMVNNFEDSTMVREYPLFKDTIKEFLEANQNYTNKCSRKNNGYIRVVYTDDKGREIPIKSYYKKDKSKLNLRNLKASIKRKCTGDLQLLKEIYFAHRHQMSENQRIYIGSRVKGRDISKTKVFDSVSNFIEYYAGMNDGYFFVRQLNREVEKYEEAKEKRERVYKTSVGKVTNVEEELFEQDIVLNKEPNVVRCVKSIEDPDVLFSIFDIDELDQMEPEDIPTYVNKRN